MRAGKHYVSFHNHGNSDQIGNVYIGVMRPGQANQNTIGTPLYKQLFRENFSRSIGRGECNNENGVQCCMYNSFDAECYTCEFNAEDFSWDGMESMSSGDEMGMLLDLDEGTLSVYKNERKLGAMKSGLAGPYCWVVSMGEKGVSITIKRGTLPSS